MFLTLNHQNPAVFPAAKILTSECYNFTLRLPPEEKSGMSSQIRRAALAVYFNIAEGCSRKSVAERKQFFEIARRSIIEIEAAFDIAEILHYFDQYPKDKLKNAVVECFKILTGLIKS